MRRSGSNNAAGHQVVRSNRGLPPCVRLSLLVRSTRCRDLDDCVSRSQLNDNKPLRKSICKSRSRKKSRPNSPSIPAVGGSVWASTARLDRSSLKAMIRGTTTNGEKSMPLPVVTWTRSDCRAGSNPTVTSIATLIIVRVAPVSRAHRTMMLPVGPKSSTGNDDQPAF